MANVLARALGRGSWHGLLHDRSVDAARAPTYYMLFLIDLKTRRAHVAGLTTTPDGAFMAQVARNLPDPEDGFLRAHHFVICDRDAKFTAEFRRILQAVGVRVIRTPRQAPNGNAHAERFVLSIKSECLNRMMFFGEASWRRAVGAYLQHDHRERPHQGAGTRRSIPRRGPRRGSFGALSDSPASSNMTRERRNDGRYHSVSCNHPPVATLPRMGKRDDTTDIAEQVFEDLRRAPHVYLLPEYGDADSEREILDDFWPDLFAAMLNCWLTDEQQWPKNRTHQMFAEWFDLQMCPVGEDLHLDEALVELD